MTENERLTLKSVNGDVWLLDSEGKPYLLSVDGDDYNNALNRLADFEAIGTIGEFKALKEKSVAKKPKHYGDSEDGKLECPNCEEDLWELIECGFSNCPYCGQKLDWE
ncbi:MAG: hypothetical protein J6A75_02575 [Lachnospiraceae bacterium]|nr:hypothetical protein [Lachnospiraceae bacterium]